MLSLGPNTNVSSELLRADCVLLVGEDPRCAEAALTRTFGCAEMQHGFRGYLFQRRSAVTTIFSGMGTGCVQPLIWELAAWQGLRRLVLVGTAGLLPGSKLAYARPYVITRARAAGSGIDAVGLTGAYQPRWPLSPDVPSATAVSTDFYYGFGEAIRDPAHPLASTKLRELYEASVEQLVDMEVAAFYALCGLCMPRDVSYVAVKSPSNPAGDATDHLANTPAGLAACIEFASRLLKEGLETK